MPRVLVAIVLLAIGNGAVAVDPDNSVLTPAELEQAYEAKQAEQRKQAAPTAKTPKTTEARPSKPTVPVAKREIADQAALETQPFGGPRFGMSRVERRREKCRGQAQAQNLTGDALQRHLQSCVKR